MATILRMFLLEMKLKYNNKYAKTIHFQLTFETSVKNASWCSNCNDETLCSLKNCLECAWWTNGGQQGLNYCILSIGVALNTDQS